MKERPILFNDEMVRAILDGRKTQTRRPIKPQPIMSWITTTDERGKLAKVLPTAELCIHEVRGPAPKYEAVSGLYEVGWTYSDGSGEIWAYMQSPFGVPGDRLYVRETWKRIGDQVWYRAGGPGGGADTPYHGSRLVPLGNWKPSIHMPKALSRITVDVERVWVERVQEASKLDLVAEGYPMQREPEEAGTIQVARQYDIPDIIDDEVVLWFADTWDAIYAAKGFGYAANPWVWCCEWKVVSA